MDRPSEPQLDAVMSAANELRDLEAQTAQEIAEAKRRLAVKVDALGEIAEPSALLKAAVYAYWHAPEVSANQLALLTVGKPSAMVMLRRSGAVSIGVPCVGCGEDLAITSRTMMREVLTVAVGASQSRPGYRVYCLDCRQKQDEERERAYDLERRKKEERRLVLAGLSYAEYLATPEWKAYRESLIHVILQEHGKLICEICSDNEGLSFVHSLLDLADEREVVSLLCATCSNALESAGKLAHPPLPANRAPRIEIDLAERAFRTEHSIEA